MTVSDADEPGHLIVRPGAVSPTPVVSAVNWAPGTTATNGVVVAGLGLMGDIRAIGRRGKRVDRAGLIGAADYAGLTGSLTPPRRG